MFGLLLAVYILIVLWYKFDPLLFYKVRVLFGRSLKVGDKVRLSGGYDGPTWINGSVFIDGEVVGFIKKNPDTKLTVVHLERTIKAKSVEGDYLVLSLRYVGAKWIRSEIVHVELFDSLPQEGGKSGVWIESHAVYKILAKV